MRIRFTALLLAPLFAGCIVEAPTTANAPEAKTRSAAARQVPERAPLRGGVKFGDKIEYVGGEISPGALVPGEGTRVTLGFRALTELDADYQLFVHVEDVDGKFERFNLDHAPGGGTTPTSGWKPGVQVRDVFVVSLPPNVTSRGVRVWFGFWHPPTGARLKIANPEAVVNDGRDRALLAQIAVAQ